jgi:hypothetical protein
MATAMRNIPVGTIFRVCDGCGHVCCHRGGVSHICQWHGGNRVWDKALRVIGFSKLWALAWYASAAVDICRACVCTEVGGLAVGSGVFLLAVNFVIAGSEGKMFANLPNIERLVCRAGGAGGISSASSVVFVAVRGWLQGSCGAGG